MNGNVQEQKPNHKASEQARREDIGLVVRDTNHKLLQATERPHVHPRAWLEDWCKACAFTHTDARAYAACDFLGMWTQ